LEKRVTHAPAGTPIPDALRGVAGALQEFLAGSESVFLEAGSHLARLERRARAILDAAHGAVEKGAAPTDDPVELLERELVRLDAYLRRAQESSEAGLLVLGRLPPELEPVLRAVSGYETIAPTLRMLGMNTRIENARASSQNGGMETVASEVRRLADLVEPRFQAVERDTRTLLDFAQRARASAEAFLARQLASAAELLGELRRALAALRSIDAAERAVARGAVGASERLRRDLGAVLVALQAHDATRQALEHVIAELGMLAQAPPDGGDTAGAGAASCRVLPAQLRGARGHLLAALDGIQLHLRDLAAQGAELRQAAEQYATGEAGRAPLADVARAVTRATVLLRSHVAFEEEAAQAFRRVTETVQTVATSVRDIQGIGSAIRIIALNALVETERAGSGGRVLAVLAQGMGGVAADVVRRTEGASRALAEVSRVAAALADAAGGSADAPGAAVASALERLGAELDEHHRTLQRSLETLHVESRSLEQEVEVIARHVAEQGAAARLLAEPEERLATIAEAAFGRAGGGADPARAYARYTMDSERSIHDRALGRAQPAPDARLPGSDLGSNVELF
jgi:hypothetical protein